MGRLDQSSPAAAPLPGGGSGPGSTQLLRRELHEASPDPHWPSPVLSDGLHGGSGSRSSLQSSTTCQRLQTFALECNLITCFAVNNTCLFLFFNFFSLNFKCNQIYYHIKKTNRCIVSWHSHIGFLIFILFIFCLIKSHL